MTTEPDQPTESLGTYLRGLPAISVVGEPSIVEMPRDDGVPSTSAEHEVVLGRDARRGLPVRDPSPLAIRSHRHLSHAQLNHDVAALVAGIADPADPTEHQPSEAIIACRLPTDHLLQRERRIVRIVRADGPTGAASANSPATSARTTADRVLDPWRRVCASGPLRGSLRSAADRGRTTSSPPAARAPARPRSRRRRSAPRTPRRSAAARTSGPSRRARARPPLRRSLVA